MATSSSSSLRSFLNCQLQSPEAAESGPFSSENATQLEYNRQEDQGNTFSLGSLRSIPYAQALRLIPPKTQPSHQCEQEHRVGLFPFQHLKQGPEIGDPGEPPDNHPKLCPLVNVLAFYMTVAQKEGVSARYSTITDLAHGFVDFILMEENSDEYRALSQEMKDLRQQFIDKEKPVLQRLRRYQNPTKPAFKRAYEIFYEHKNWKNTAYQFLLLQTPYEFDSDDPQKSHPHSFRGRESIANIDRYLEQGLPVRVGVDRLNHDGQSDHVITITSKVTRTCVDKKGRRTQETYYEIMDSGRGEFYEKEKWPRKILLIRKGKLVAGYFNKKGRPVVHTSQSWRDRHESKERSPGQVAHPFVVVHYEGYRKRAKKA